MEKNYEDYTLQQLESEKENHWDEFQKIRSIIEKKKVENYKYVGKYLHINSEGYIYVTSIKYDNTHSLYNNDMIIIHGFYFNGDDSEYIDDYFFEVDGYHVMKLNIDVFNYYIRENEIEEMTKEQFFDRLTKLSTKFNEHIPEMFDLVEKKNEKD